jgi:nicotinamide mononucleotide transporter
VDPWLLAEAVGVVFGVAYVVLAIREDPWCWPAGMVSVLTYAAVFGHARLYGAAGLQVVYLAFSIYGWHAWRHGGARGGRLVVSRVPARWAWGLAAGSSAGALGLGLLFARFTDDALPFLDGGTTAVSLAAQWMATRKWLESWLVWIAVDAVYVAMYASRRLHGTAALYLLFLAMAVLGYREWRCSAARQAGAAGSGAAES